MRRVAGGLDGVIHSDQFLSANDNIISNVDFGRKAGVFAKAA